MVVQAVTAAPAQSAPVALTDRQYSYRFRPDPVSDPAGQFADSCVVEAVKAISAPVPSATDAGLVGRVVSTIWPLEQGLVALAFAALSSVRTQT